MLKRIALFVLAPLTLIACGQQELDSRLNGSQSQSHGGARGRTVTSTKAPKTCGVLNTSQRYYVGSKLIGRAFNIYKFEDKSKVGNAYFDGLSAIIDAFEKENNLNGKTVKIFDEQGRLVAKARLSVLIGAQSYSVYDCNNKYIGGVRIGLTSSLLSALGGNPSHSVYEILDANKKSVAKSAKVKWLIDSFFIDKVQIHDTLLGWQISLNGSDLDPRVLTFIPIMKTLSRNK